MVAKREPRRGPRIEYRCRVKLFRHEWEELRMEAQSRGITGGELIGAVLSRYIVAMGDQLEPPEGDEPTQDA